MPSYKCLAATAILVAMSAIMVKGDLLGDTGSMDNVQFAGNVTKTLTTFLLDECLTVNGSCAMKVLRAAQELSKRTGFSADAVKQLEATFGGMTDGEKIRAAFKTPAVQVMMKQMIEMAKKLAATGAGSAAAGPTKGK
ncbi:hypothetical protein HDE_14164 [Halotydeus destructor]|nr:hypothetical protein HDE_14164 [Halotydeus destructor]